MFVIDWLIVGLLFVAGVRAVGDIALDALALARNPKTEVLPSTVRRKARTDLAQQRAAARVELAERQAAAGIPPAPGQAAADRIARFVADPPPWPPWVIALANYLGLLLSDRLAQARRQHVANESARMRGERGRRPRARGPFCDTCDVNPVKRRGDLCPSCAAVVLDECAGCHAHVPVAELVGDRCETCRRRADSPPTPDPDAPLQLVTFQRPAWLPNN
jgi:hypothetical protein